MKPNSIPPLEKLVSEGQLAERAWLLKHGYSGPRVDAALRSQRLEVVVRGVYRRPGPPLKWEHLVYSLNRMDYHVHVGGHSALVQSGMAHYLNISGNPKIDLYGALNLPAWVGKFSHLERNGSSMKPPAVNFSFTVHPRPRFQTHIPAAVTTKLFGTWDWPIPHSTPELAFLELLDGLKDEADFEQADKIFEAAASLRPMLLKDLLASCKSIKAKRLLLWFGARHGHQWYAEIDRDRIELGKGKRMLVRGGSFDSQYEITVPKSMTRGNEQLLY